MNFVLILLDVSPDPAGLGSWGAVILLLAIVMVLAVAFAGGLVFLLIWLKRRKTKGAEESEPASESVGKTKTSVATL